MKIPAIVTIASVILPLTALAESPFDGSWKSDPADITLSKRPWVYTLKDGEYKCVNCVPAYSVKADGTDQKVAGHPFDDLVVTSDSSSIHLTYKLHGTVQSTETDSVSADGKTLTVESKDTSGAQPVLEKDVYLRLAPVPPGAHPASGAWRQTKVVSESDAGLTVTFAITDLGMSFKLNGMSCDAKFDGKKYPLVNDPNNGLVLAKRLSSNEFKMDIFEDGKLTLRFKYKFAPDGSVMRITGARPATHETWGFVTHKVS